RRRASSPEPSVSTKGSPRWKPWSRSSHRPGTASGPTSPGGMTAAHPMSGTCIRSCTPMTAGRSPSSHRSLSTEGASEMSEYPELLHTVIDTTAPRRSAEFYRQLLGYAYRPGDEPSSGRAPNAGAEQSTGDDAEEPDWLVLTDGRGRRKLAFQQVD